MRSVLPTSFVRIGSTVQPLTFKNKSGNLIEIFVYNDGLFRVRHTPPGQNHIGTDLDCDSLLPSNDFTVKTEGFKYFVSTCKVQLEISLENSDFNLSWSTGNNIFLKDLPYRAYEYDRDGGVSHYVQQIDHDLHYGMGERSSPLQLNGRRWDKLYYLIEIDLGLKL